jgi:hypothetical protein
MALHLDWCYLHDGKIIFNKNQKKCEIFFKNNSSTNVFFNNFRNGCVNNLIKCYLNRIIENNFNYLAKWIINNLDLYKNNTTEVNYSMPLKTAIYFGHYDISKLLIKKLDSPFKQYELNQYMPFVDVVLKAKEVKKFENLIPIMLDKLESKIDVAFSKIFNSAIELFRNEQYCLSINLFKLIIERDKNRLFTNVAKYILPQIYLKIGDFNNASLIYKELCAKENNNIEFMCELAWCHYHLNEIDEASKLFKSATLLYEENRNFRNSLLNQVIMRISLGDFVLANEILTKFESRNVENFYIYTIRALLYGFQCQEEKMREQIEIAKVVNLNYHKVEETRVSNEAYIFHILAHIYYFNGRYEDANRCIQEIKKRKSLDISNQVLHVNILIDQGKYKEVEKTLDIILQINKGNKVALLAKAYSELEAAKRILNQNFDPSHEASFNFHYIRALIYFKEDRYTDAKIIIMQARKFNCFYPKLLELENNVNKKLSAQEHKSESVCSSDPENMYTTVDVENLLRFNIYSYNGNNEEDGLYDTESDDLYETESIKAGK